MYLIDRRTKQFVLLDNTTRLHSTHNTDARLALEHVRNRHSEEKKLIYYVAFTNNKVEKFIFARLTSDKSSGSNLNFIAIWAETRTNHLPNADQMRFMLR